MILFVLSVYVYIQPWGCGIAVEIGAPQLTATPRRQMTTARQYETTSVWPWVYSDLFIEGFRLGDRTETDALPVVKVGSDGVWRPVCDDGWNDLTAAAMCRMYGVYNGRRTSVETDGDYALGTLRCFETYRELQDVPEYNYIFSLEECVREETEQLPCSKLQGAAAYCWDNGHGTSTPMWYEYYDITEFSGYAFFYFTFRARWVKMGTFYNFLDDLTLADPPLAKHFTATACGEPVALTLETKNKQYTLSGAISPECNTCFDIYVKEDLLFDKVCKKSRTHDRTKGPSEFDFWTTDYYQDKFDFFQKF